MWKIALFGCLLPLSVLAEFAAVNGVKMYYEIHGQGRPVVLLHSGMHGIQSSFAKQIAVLARGHKVIAIEQMAHGHTAAVPGRPLSYELMAQDTAALLLKLGVTNADLIGWSDGGQLVRRVVASGVGLGASAAIVKDLGAPVGFPKMAADMFPKGALADLLKIKRPVLIVAGDGDFCPIEETTRIYRAIPGAKLFILPGTGHTTFQDRPDWFNPVLLDFLDQK